MPSSTLEKRKKLLAANQFGLIPVLRFVSSARWRASAGAHRLVERSSLIHPTTALEIAFLSIFSAEMP